MTYIKAFDCFITVNRIHTTHYKRTHTDIATQSLVLRGQIAFFLLCLGNPFFPYPYTKEKKWSGHARLHRATPSPKLTAPILPFR